MSKSPSTSSRATDSASGPGSPASILHAPETWQLAAAAIERLGADQQMDLLLDYGNNIPQYEALHAFIREYRPPILAIWGDKDPFFTPAGAEAFRRDNPEAEVHLLDTGHSFSVAGSARRVRLDGRRRPESRSRRAGTHDAQASGVPASSVPGFRPLRAAAC